MHEHRFRTTRNARYFSLGQAGPEVSDIWVVCHGYGQLARDFVTGLEPVAAPDRLIAAPEALSRFYTTSPDARQPGTRVGASWMTREDRLAEIEDQVAYLDGVATELLGQAKRGARLRGLGFSQGASTVCRWAALGTAPLTEVILWGGEIPADLPDPLLGERLGRMVVHLVAGLHDRLVPDPLVAHQETRLRSSGLEPRMHRFEGGHRLDSTVLRAIAEGG